MKEIKKAKELDRGNRSLNVSAGKKGDTPSDRQCQNHAGHSSGEEATQGVWQGVSVEGSVVGGGVVIEDVAGG